MGAPVMGEPGTQGPGVGVGVGAGGPQVTSLCADAITTSTAPSASVLIWTCSRWTVSDEVDVPLPPAICSLMVTEPLTTSGMLIGITVLGGGSAPNGMPAITRLARVVPAALLLAVVPSQVLLDSAVTTSAVTRPASRSMCCTDAVLVESALLGAVVPLVSTAIVPVERRPTRFTPATAAEAVPPSGASTTSGNSVRLIAKDEAETPYASPLTLDCAAASSDGIGTVVQRAATARIATTVRLRAVGRMGSPQGAGGE